MEEYNPPKVIPIRPDHEATERKHAERRHPSSHHIPDPEPEFSDAVAMFLLTLFLVAFWSTAVYLIIRLFS